MPEIPDEVSRLLLVEGTTDKQFFIKLVKYLNLTDGLPHILEYRGKNRLQAYLRALLLEDNFFNITHIGIVRDADYGTDAFNSIQTALKNANHSGLINGNVYPVPDDVMTFTENTPKVTALVLPDRDVEGMLETVILEAFTDDPVYTCMEDYFECLGQNLTVARESLQKAKTEVFIAGKYADENTTNKDRKRKQISDIFGTKWWTDEIWEHPTFDDVKRFLRLITTDNID